MRRASRSGTKLMSVSLGTVTTSREPPSIPGE
jgi:hypothetical protein